MGKGSRKGADYYFSNKPACSNQNLCLLTDRVMELDNVHFHRLKPKHLSPPFQLTFNISLHQIIQAGQSLLVLLFGFNRVLHHYSIKVVTSLKTLTDVYKINDKREHPSQSKSEILI